MNVYAYYVYIEIEGDSFSEEFIENEKKISIIFSLFLYLSMYFMLSMMVHIPINWYSRAHPRIVNMVNYMAAKDDFDCIDISVLHR